MSNMSAFVTFLMAVVAINFCFGQIHFTPDWGQGKRSQNSHVDEQDTSYCQEQLELNLMFEVTNMLTVSPGDKSLYSHHQHHCNQNHHTAFSSCSDRKISFFFFFFNTCLSWADVFNVTYDYIKKSTKISPGKKVRCVFLLGRGDCIAKEVIDMTVISRLTNYLYN